MILLGLIIILVAVGAGTLLFLATQSLAEEVDLDAAGFAVSATPLALLVAGAAVMALLWLGTAMIRGSMRRRSKRRREAKEAQRQAEAEARIREEERARAARTSPVQERAPGAGPGSATADEGRVDAGDQTRTRQGPDDPGATQRVTTPDRTATGADDSTAARNQDR